MTAPTRRHTTLAPPTAHGMRRVVVRTLQLATATFLVLALTVLVVQTRDTTPVAEDEATTSARTATVVDESAALRRLVALGYVPAAAWDAEAEATRRLVARGLVPAGTEATRTTGDDTVSVTRDLVARGLVPAGTLEPDGGEEAVTRDLVARRLVPPGTRP